MRPYSGGIIAVLVGFLAFQATHIQSSGTLPSSCTIGDIYIKTGTSAGLYACIATNTWTGPYATSAGGLTVPGSTTDNAIVRWDGTGGTAIQNSGITINDSNVIAFPDGVKQTFNPDGTNAGLNVGSQAGAPSSLADGDLWYDSTANKFKCRQNGATTDCVSTATGGATYIIKPSDESVNNTNTGTTFQDDNDLTFSPTINATYVVDLVIRVVSASNTPDIKFDWTVPTGATFINDVSGCVVSAATNDCTFSTYSLAVGNALAFGVVSNPIGIRAHGVLTMSSNTGSLTLRWAQNTGSATNTTVQAKSTMAYQCLTGC